MNILFLSLVHINSLEEHGIYQDLLREFLKNGHNLTILSASQKKRQNKELSLEGKKYTVIQIHTGRVEKETIIRKGINTVLLPYRYIYALKKYTRDRRFDLILYPTPPITLEKVVAYIKRRDRAKSYLLLKDIFPQNALDLGMLSKKGVKGIFYRYFKKKEKRLYSLSDYIGCMSPANVQYLLHHNPSVFHGKVELCPNSISCSKVETTEEEKKRIREKYALPVDRIIMVYGGNLGKPQGIPYMMDCLMQQKGNQGIFFLIVGDGTEFDYIKKKLQNNELNNVKLLQSLKKEDYETVVASCDVGLLFLDYRFTIPNFPSRILSYMQAKLPVFACVDKSTDIGNIVESGGFGWMCYSNSIEAFNACIQKIEKSNLQAMGDRAYQYLQEHYTVEEGYAIIMKHFA